MGDDKWFLVHDILKRTQTRQEGGIYGLMCHDLWPMTGEISPDMMLWGFCAEWSKMSVNE